MSGNNHTFNSLRAGAYCVEGIPDGGVSDLVSLALDLGKASGIAYTSTGASAVRSVSGADGDSAVVITTSGGSIDLGTVYELRLWRFVDGGADATGGLVAEELRWLNGFGAVRVTLTDSPNASGHILEAPHCWYQRIEYLQHQGTSSMNEECSEVPGERGADKTQAAPSVMTCVEVFQSETAYSNAVFVDQLMTGRWN